MDWLIAEYGFTPTDAYCLVSTCPDFRINVYQMCKLAKLNYVAGAQQCAAATSAMSSGQSLLLAIHFNGSTHDVLTATQKSQLLSWASTLDQYNNNNLC
jgi:hypothetical protein